MSSTGSESKNVHVWVITVRGQHYATAVRADREHARHWVERRMESGGEWERSGAGAVERYDVEGSTAVIQRATIEDADALLIFDNDEPQLS